MKYIRTKDEVLVLSTKHEHLAQEYGAIKVAETIKELCDEFVIVIGKKTCGYMVLNQCCNNFKMVVSLNKQAKENDAIIYGAIWTDKGLIYVAKMNDKGELELL